MTMRHANSRMAKHVMASSLTMTIFQVFGLDRPLLILNLGAKGCVTKNCMLQHKNFEDSYWSSYSLIGEIFCLKHDN